MSKFVLAGIVLSALICGFLYWLVTAPKRIKLAPDLQPLPGFSFQTPLLRVPSPEMEGMILMSRRTEVQPWVGAGPFSNFKTTRVSGFHVDYIRIDGVFAIEGVPSLIVGRYRDRGSGMHGWHATLRKKRPGAIDLQEHQQYEVWLEHSPPETIGTDGVPKSSRDDRWFFTGLADVIGENYYNGYTPSLR